jgi:signal transduction histidine kinase
LAPVPPNPPSQPTPPSPSAPRKMGIDASSLEQAMNALQQRIDLLQQSLSQQQKLAMLGMVTAVIAHEFNNILTPMISYTKFALGEKADEALRQKALTKALGGAERLANISKSLLGFARGDETTSVPVLLAVRETLGCLARDPSKDGITLTVEVSEDLAVAMNAGHFQQVLMNLIVNARSAMLTGANGSHGGVGGIKRLKIRARLVQRPVDARDPGPGGAAKSVEISVTDTGPGIPREIIGRIFEPFFSTKRGEENQAAAEADASRGGTGLGLTICKQLVESAGGKIWVVSEVGQGTSFFIHLPSA